MNLRYIKAVAIGAVLITVIIILLAVEEKDPHRFEGKCDLCHVGMKDPSILTREPNHLCLSCHPDNVKRSHPSDIIPSKKLPSQFPLYRNKMVCVTCHFPHHRQGQEQPGEGQEQQGENPVANKIVPGPYLLRSKVVGKVFCYTCHRGNFVNTAVDSHAVAYKKAHTAIVDFEQKGMIDDNSRECLSCHDGTISTEAGADVRGLSWEHKKDIGLSHPIGVDYESVYLKHPRSYRSPQGLDARIVLVNGKIGCITCHNHYSKHKKHLVMDNFKSRLCLSCHNL